MSFLFKRPGAGAQFQVVDAAGYRSQFVESQADHVLVDVRTPGEYRDGHVPGAVNIPLEKLGARLSEVPQDKPVVLVCASGNRSASAAEQLVTAGYSEVYNLKGGTMRWMMNGFPIEK
ncbi:MAG: rhodanese-like domain-containing protein [Chloroflexi bacterium]|nr:rhodanese-like domain-containing protein [Chloroflexota bacterium]